MGKKAQVLIISLWILVILTILSVSIGHRVSMALRLSRYHKESLKAAYLAKAGIQIAIVEIEKDDPSFDSLQDKWSDNKDKYEFINLGDQKNEFATVTLVEDEERKININTAPFELISELLNTVGVPDPDELAVNICAWRGDGDATIPDYQLLGYDNKGKKFSNIEELMLVKGFNEQAYDSIEDLITIYPQEGQALINVNTASSPVLEILMNTYIKKLQQRNIPIGDSQALLQAAIDFRSKGGFFTDTNIDSMLANLTDEQKNILNDPTDGIKSKISVRSNYFHIVSEGHIDASKLTRVIECVFDRQNRKIVSLHEN